MPGREDPYSQLPRSLGEPIEVPQRRRIGMVVLRISVAVIACIASASIIIGYVWLKNLGVFSLDNARVEELKHHTFADNTIIYDRNGTRIGEFFDRYQIYVPVRELPNHLIEAITAIEDKDFYVHKGIDTSAIIRAAWSRIRRGKFTQGASTITQQVVKQRLLSSERTIERKIIEIAWALKLEKNLSKDQILEIYTNSMFLGNGSYGVGAAARRYFGKDVRHLNPAESALIAGLFQSPSRYNPARYPERAKRRQNAVLKAMVAQKHLSQAEAKIQKDTALVYHNYKPINYETAPWFIDWVREQLPPLLSKKYHNSEGAGLRVYTTLDTNLQALAEKSIASSSGMLSSIENKTGTVINPENGERRLSRLEASMLVTDPKDGSILAMVGGRNYRESQFNRTVSAMRSPGSAFKPVVYTEALMHGWKWSDVIYVSPINIENYKPHTPDDDFLTETTMMRAFYRSMNTPTVEIASRVGLPAIITRAKSLGIRSPIKNEFGSTLGSSDVNMFDLARMYSVFASQGRLNEIQGILKVTTSDGQILYDASIQQKAAQQVLPPQISYLMTQGMKAVLASGTGIRSKDLAEIAAGKTGTSNDSTDNWFCGYTSSLTAVVWVGTDEHTPIQANVTGGALALPIWDQFIRSANLLSPIRPLEPPPGVIAQAVHPRYGHRMDGGMTMWFLDSNQPSQTNSALESIESRSRGEYRRVFTH